MKLGSMKVRRAVRISGLILAALLLFAEPRVAKAQAAPNAPGAARTVAQAVGAPANAKQDSRCAKEEAGKAASSGAANNGPCRHRKVITNDDIDAAHARESKLAGENGSGQVYGAIICDAECAEEVRQAMGYGPEQEGEWQMRLMTARRNLAADGEWRSSQRTLEEAVKTYCTFQYQQGLAVLPTGNTWNEGVERAQQAQYVESMNRVLGERVQGANAELYRLANSVRATEPVRATIITVLSSRVFTNSCLGEDP
jgi:hypothetical protein